MSKESGQAEAITEPKPSLLPDSVLTELAPRIELSKYKISDELLQDLTLYQRASNFLAAAMIFLTEGTLEPEKELTHEMVKKRLLGHWIRTYITLKLDAGLSGTPADAGRYFQGTCPGLSAVQAHTNRLIRDFDANMTIIWGPGHGAPGVLSGLWLEGSITKFYSSMTMDKAGFDRFVKAFSWPGGFPSHINAETPGAIHEGGELGYALSVAYGAVMDYPDLIAVAVIGDGEAETGPTAAAWHAHKFLDPGESGAVLPILHANGFKISERTIMGCSDDKELTALFTGYGYQCAIVDYGDLANESPEQDRNLQVNLAATMNWAYDEIRHIQQQARNDNPITKPRWPMIVLRTPKGWTGPKSVDGLPVVNSFRAHQVPLMKARTDDGQLNQLKDWLASYKPLELFDPSQPNIVKETTTAILPKDPSKRLGQLKLTYNGHKPLKCPDWTTHASNKNEEESPMKAIGRYLSEIVQLNPTNFRIFSPDELRSNKLDQVFEHTTRNMQWDPETAHKGGRVSEMLSEHTLQGFLQGYTLTGRTGLFPSYEAFLGIVTTMVQQYAKFCKVAQTDAKWRGPISSLNYIETSTLWRQEHNGYSHQNPGLINALLDLPHQMVRVYFPPDANCSVSVIAHCLRSTGYVNLLVGSKSPAKNLLTPEQANEHCIAGISAWPQYSTHNGEDPDVVLVGCGNETTTEVLHACKILSRDFPDLRIRVVNIVDLLALAIPGAHPHALSDAAFDSLFTPDKPAIINFHGYPSAVHQLLFPRGNAANPSRFTIGGYQEVGTTTTPAMMLRYNECCRYDVAIKALQGILQAKRTNKIDVNAHKMIAKYMHMNRELEKHALRTGEDPPEFQQAVLHEG